LIECKIILADTRDEIGHNDKGEEGFGGDVEKRGKGEEKCVKFAPIFVVKVCGK